LIEVVNAGLLAPTIKRLSLNPSLVGGVLTRGTATVDLANGASIVQRGLFSTQVFVSPDGAIDGSQTLLGKIKQRVTVKAERFIAETIKLSESHLAVGTYRLVIESTDPSGKSSFFINPASITVSAPLVNLSAAVTRVSKVTTPASIATMTVTITNNGNIAATGPATYSIGVSADQTTVAYTVQTGKKALKINAGKSVVLRIRFSLKGHSAQGNFPAFSLTLAGQSLASFGANVFEYA
jgi:hypothetical protein